MPADIQNVNITVVIATYNGEQFLKKQLDSILGQTIVPKEIIVVDDCSTDGTVAILKEYAAANASIQLIVNETNLGYVGNFEKGMLLAKGDLIALSDQDDIWKADKLEKLYQHLGDHFLVYSDSELIDENDKNLNKKMSDIKNQIAYDNCLMYTIGAWAPGHTFLLKKELVDRCVPFPSIVTHDFWLGFVATCYSPIQYVSEPLVLYRQHLSNAIGANTQAKKTNQIKPSKKALEEKSIKRMRLLYEKCPSNLTEQKQVLGIILETYQHPSLIKNFNRMLVFLQYRNIILAYKRKSALMKILFCVKMFFKIDY